MPSSIAQFFPVSLAQTAPFSQVMTEAWRLSLSLSIELRIVNDWRAGHTRDSFPK